MERTELRSYFEAGGTLVCLAITDLHTARSMSQTLYGSGIPAVCVHLSSDTELDIFVTAADEMAARRLFNLVREA